MSMTTLLYVASYVGAMSAGAVMPKLASSAWKKLKSFVSKQVAP